ncbi:MAG: 2,3-bisphosphoglycerate-independent phosphoglycerate mutase [Nitrospinota bacterium]
MADLQLPDALVQDSDSKIVYLILDGLGDLPTGPGGLTPLEAARTPNLDALCERGISGLLDPVQPGVTPGSGPGHLSLFGYDPVAHPIGRGVLSALGLKFPLQPGDVAARMNFATVDAAGNVTDRRAGRIDDETNRRLVERLNGGGESASLDGVECFVRPEKEHRALVVFRGEGLTADVSDTDPQAVGVPPLAARATAPEGERTARAVNAFVRRAKDLLSAEPRANAALLRGLDTLAPLPSMAERYRFRALAIAGYPMYRGLARLVGMEVSAGSPDLNEQADMAAQKWNDFDFFYIHVKATDVYGENGDFDGKRGAIEQVDAVVPRIADLLFGPGGGKGPDTPPNVLVVTGDHSTPVSLKAHSWHPVPVLLCSPTCRPDGRRPGGDRTFGERYCAAGGLGRLPMRYLMSIALAHAGRLMKFRA